MVLEIFCEQKDKHVFDGEQQQEDGKSKINLLNKFDTRAIKIPPVACSRF